MPIIIVSGLPRSGTSLMMQMFKAGGLELLADDTGRPIRITPVGILNTNRSRP